MPNSRILVIGDLHCPYQHPDAIKFLRAIQREYDPDRIINIGDEVDFHAMSFHESDPDLYAASDELEKAKDAIWEIQEIYPKVDVIESNHGSLYFRKAKTHGFPRELLKPYKEVLQTPNWNWHFDLKVRLPNKQFVYFHHGKSANVLSVSQTHGMNVVQGHYHEKFGAQYWRTPQSLHWAAQTGCLIDKDSLAFAYGRNNLKSPIIGSMMIIDSHPRMLPMTLKTGGRWNGRLV